MNIGKAIKTLRLRHKISQKTLAKKVGISQSYLSLIEKGEREPGFELIKHIADFLNIPQQVIIFLACDEKLKDKRFAKPLKKLALLIDDILKSA